MRSMSRPIGHGIRNCHGVGESRERTQTSRRATYSMARTTSLIAVLSSPELLFSGSRTVQVSSGFPWATGSRLLAGGCNTAFAGGGT